MSLSGSSIGFIGAGQMASALAQGLVNAGAYKPGQIHLSDRDRNQLQQLSAKGFIAATDNKALVSSCSVIILAVKPQVMASVLKDISSVMNNTKLIISVAAGITISSMQQALPAGSRIVRVMPNTPCLVGLSASAIAAGEHATPSDVELTKKIFSAVGLAVSIEESKLDAVTGLSGSGPAYAFLFIEALADGGVRAGLPRDVAMSLAAQTVYGSAKMVLLGDRHPGSLKDSVASPAGTTIAGLHALELGAFRGTVMSAVKAASDRATELSRPVTSKL